MKLRIKGDTLRLRVTQDELAASLAGNTIEVRVPARAAREWSQTDLVTLAGTQTLPQGTLRIVVEKDWACLAPREGEAESDQFPHPEGRAKSC